MRIRHRCGAHWLEVEARFGRDAPVQRKNRQVFQSLHPVPRLYFTAGNRLEALILNALRKIGKWQIGGGQRLLRCWNAGRWTRDYQPLANRVAHEIVQESAMPE